MPPDESEQRVVLEDLVGVKDTALRGIDDARVQMVASPKDDSIRRAERLEPTLRRRCSNASTTRKDRERRLALARRALEGALAGSGRFFQASPTTSSARRLKAKPSVRSRGKAYDAELAALVEECAAGRFPSRRGPPSLGVLREGTDHPFLLPRARRIRGTIVAVFAACPEAPVGSSRRRYE